MKKVLLALVLSCFFFPSYSQNVNIPDVHFWNELIGNYSINTNYDSEISLSEASAFTGTLDVMDKSITSLTGIEAFVNLTILACDNNLLTSLDVSKNTALTHLSCSKNQLTSLDVSKNIHLTLLDCFMNSISSLDVSKNKNLLWLNCLSNKLKNLDVTENTNLTVLICSGNKLISLDGANHSTLTSLDCGNNPALRSICIKSISYADTHTMYFQKDDSARWIENCGEGVENTTNPTISIYPNPLISNATVSFNSEVNNTSLKMLDMMGREVCSLNFSGKQVIIDRGDLAAGVYLINVISNKEIISTQKILIQ
jgi:hypothetical protein